MFWTVKSKTNKTRLSGLILLKELLGKASSKEKPDLNFLADTLAKYLEDANVLSNLSLKHLLGLGINAGYYYKVFLSKNEVEIDAELGETTQQP